MKQARRRAARHPGIARIDQDSTRTHGWFARAGWHLSSAGRYVPRYRKFFGDVSHGGKRRALEAAQEYLAGLPGRKKRGKPRARRRARRG